MAGPFHASRTTFHASRNIYAQQVFRDEPFLLHLIVEFLQRLSNDFVKQKFMMRWGLPWCKTPVCVIAISETQVETEPNQILEYSQAIKMIIKFQVDETRWS